MKTIACLFEGIYVLKYIFVCSEMNELQDDVS